MRSHAKARQIKCLAGFLFFADAYGAAADKFMPFEASNCTPRATPSSTTDASE
jgi:hypothetical protein